MTKFDQIIDFSKRLAAAYLNKKEHNEIVEESKLFNTEDKNYIINNINDDSSIKKRLNLTNQIDKEIDWKKVEKRMEGSHQKFYRRLSVAAAISAIIFASYIFRDTFFNSPLEQTSVVLNIEPGKGVAILTLEDDSNITLEKGKNYVSTNSTSNGEKLIYNSGKISKSKTVFNLVVMRLLNINSLKIQ